MTSDRDAHVNVTSETERKEREHEERNAIFTKERTK